MHVAGIRWVRTLAELRKWSGQLEGVGCWGDAGKKSERQLQTCRQDKSSNAEVKSVISKFSMHNTTIKLQ